MVFVGLIGTALSTLNQNEGIYRVASIDEFLYEISNKSVRRVDALACMQQVGNQFFVEHYGNLPFMQYYVTLKSDTETGRLQLNEPVAQHLLRSPPEIYPKNNEYAKQTVVRAEELIQIIHKARPNVWTRLYGIDGKFLKNGY